jgi:hypothetical protein
MHLIRSNLTYVVKEFGIDLLSKDTMHSDISIYVAFSRESFIRRPLHRKRSAPEDARVDGMGGAEMMTREYMDKRMKDEQKK